LTCLVPLFLFLDVAIADCIGPSHFRTSLSVRGIRPLLPTRRWLFTTDVTVSSQTSTFSLSRYSKPKVSPRHSQEDALGLRRLGLTNSRSLGRGARRAGAAVWWRSHLPFQARRHRVHGGDCDFERRQGTIFADAALVGPEWCHGCAHVEVYGRRVKQLKPPWLFATCECF